MRWRGRKEVRDEGVGREKQKKNRKSRTVCSHLPYHYVSFLFISVKRSA